MPANVRGPEATSNKNKDGLKKQILGLGKVDVYGVSYVDGNSIERNALVFSINGGVKFRVLEDGEPALTNTTTWFDEQLRERIPGATTAKIAADEREGEQ